MKYSLYLFGSHARNDNDDSSDVDILMIRKGNSAIHQAMIEKKMSGKYGKRTSISTYSLQNIEKYFTSGHLFAWHLYNEARYIDGSDGIDFLHQLGRPHEYGNYLVDLNDFILLLDDINNLVTELNIGFEMCNLYTVARNIFFFHIYKKFGVMDFSPYSLFKRNISSPIALVNYNEYKWMKASRTFGSVDVLPRHYAQLKQDVRLLMVWIKEKQRNGEL